MPSLDHLETKWKALASEIAASVQENLEDDLFHVVTDLVRESLARLQVGVQELRKSSHVLFVTGHTCYASYEITLAGWLCFPSELEMILFIKFVWLDLIKRELLSPNDSYHETLALLEEAIEISIRAKRIPNDTIKEMIWVGLAGIADGGWLGNHFNVDDSFSVSEELAGDQAWISENEPRILKLIHAVDPKNPVHIELLETWMASWGERGKFPFINGNREA